MKTSRLVRAIATAGILSAATTSVASAHVELVSSSPAAGVNLQSAPTEVTITFDDELDPDASTFTVTDAANIEVGAGEVDLTVADRNVMKGAVTITVPGVYTVMFTVTGVDGHAVEGTFSFGFLATGPIPDATGGEPDAAMASPGPSGAELILLGVLFLILAGVMAARLVMRRR